MRIVNVGIVDLCTPASVDWRPPLHPGFPDGVRPVAINPNGSAVTVDDSALPPQWRVAEASLDTRAFRDGALAFEGSYISTWEIANLRPPEGNTCPYYVAPWGRWYVPSIFTGNFAALRAWYRSAVLDVIFRIPILTFYDPNPPIAPDEIEDEAGPAEDSLPASP